MIRRALVGLVAVVGAGVVAPPAASAAEPAAAGVKVTLVTGETVTVSPAGAVVSITRNGRRVNAEIRQGPSGTSVIPFSAGRMLASGKADPGLFNVTQLIAQGYDDAHRPELPVIAEYRAGNTVRTRGVRASAITPRLTGLKVPRDSGPQLWKSLVSGEIDHLWLDRKLMAGKPRQATAPAATSADVAATAAPQGMTGKGVRVAVISGGVDVAHPDLKGRVVASRNFNFGDGDIDGDGTAIASLIAGSGAASGGKRKGLAPDARIVNAKVFNGGNSEDSSLLAGMEWAATTQKARVAVLGLARICRFDTPGDDLIEKAIADLTRRTGTLFVVPAADFGFWGREQTLCSPGTSAAALTAGGTDAGYNDQWAGAGPSKGGHLFKPEISAGTKASVARSSTLTNPRPGTGPYTGWWSTDISAARVGAAAALLAQRRPAWKADRLKATLISTAAPTRDASPFAQGAGTVDADRAIRQIVLSTPGTHSVSFPWTNRKAVSRSITITNTGKATRTFTVSLAADPNLPTRPPAGMFTTKTKSLVIKPGKSAPVTVRIDPAKAKAGDYVAALTVRGGPAKVRAMFAAWVQPTSRKLTVRLLDAAGAPVDQQQIRAVNLKSGAETYVDVRDGTGAVTLPNGDYMVTAAYAHTNGGSNWMIGAQIVNLGGSDRTITFNGTTAKRVTGRVQDQATTDWATTTAAWTTANGETVSVSAWGGDDYPVYAIPFQHSALSFGLESRLLSVRDPRRLAFEVAHISRNGIPVDPTTTQTLGQMAKVVNTLANQSAATRGGFEATTAIPPGVHWSGMGVGVDFPSTLTMYVTGGFTWDMSVRVYEPGVGDPVRGEKRGLKLEAGKTYNLTWNLPAS
ncbi:Serine protease, subtilisin family [Thermomonospora echinospora]|uniref:Serine protease, subtilisin family n=1 Tax=Thermomonospora echinospora TaxID=1992 RepID=A0A1H6CN21_9ACTN|nr:S8 family serine peptidase [Thermomonospora echinospora]SEG74414.1 Serine protease, subtilisin family [Thermomonospora echinospora]